MLNVLVETKNEYTTHLINILTPLVFEGIQSVYKQSLGIAKENDILKIFQSFLKAIPKWNQIIIDKETNRIVNSSHSYEWINDLIKATLKANLVVLMYNPLVKNQTKIDPSLYQNIRTSDFIHRIYIECARELWNNPYLLYHNYPPIEIKRNQRDCMNIIKECIKESIRKLLPVKHILQIYLGEDVIVDDGDHFEKAMTDAEEKNLTKMIQKDLAAPIEFKDDATPQQPIGPIGPSITQPLVQVGPSITQPIGPLGPSIAVGPSVAQIDDLPKLGESMIGGNIDSNDNKSIGSKILDIINKHSETSDNPSLASSVNHSSSISDIKKSIRQESIDEKIKKVLKKDLASDSDLETSLNYSQEDNDNKYQEVFSNSVMKGGDNSGNKNKKKFFNNYLQF
jgi:hypothetical protein